MITGIVENPDASKFEALSVELNKLYPHYVEKISSGVRRGVLDLELCSHGIISEADLVNAYSGVFELPVVEEEEFSSTERFPDMAADFLSYRSCIPYAWDDETISMAVAEPYGLRELAYLLTAAHGLRPVFALARRSHIERTIHAIYLTEREEQGDEFDFELSGDLDSEEALRNMASEARIVRLVNEMFSRAVELGASDIHVEPDEKKLAIRFRIDGVLHEIMSPPLTLYPAIASRIKLVGGLNIAERRLPQDGRTEVQIGKSALDIRISTVPSMSGESIVLRILRKDAIDFSLDNVGMSRAMQEEFGKLIHLPHGIILVVGPTGSGKSTTLYSVLSMLNNTSKKIITIEDPVEYRTDGITQIQVNPNIDLTFANGLRSIVRQDPDIILVGEIRDRETAEIAIHAALTGHLVFSTLHTNDAPGAVSRLLDMGVEGFLVSSSLSGVLSQRLVRRICPVCDGDGKTKEGGRCKNCAGSGFRGRIGIFELMTVNDEIRDKINRHADSGEIAQVAMRHGMRPLIEDGMEKVAKGITTEAEVTGVTVNIEN